MKNTRVVLYSIIALIFVALAFFVNWWFLALAVILSYLSQRELMNQTKRKRK